MSVRVMAYVWELQDVKGTEKLVLLSLADFANDEGYAGPSLSTIARKCGISRRYAIDIMNKLEDAGHVQVTERKINIDKNHTNLYKVVVNQGSLVNQGSPPSEAGFTRVVRQGSPKPSINYELTVNEEERESPEPTDFDAMKIAIETLTGLLVQPTQAEVDAINAMVTEGITWDNLRAAVAWFRDNKKVVRGAASLLNSARYNKAQQTQASVVAPRKTGGNLMDKTAQIKSLLTYYSKPIDSLPTYLAGVDDLDYNILAMAIAERIKTATFAPRVNELRAAYDGIVLRMRESASVT